MSDIFEIGSAALSASVNAHGAQLWTLRDRSGRDLLWDGDPKYWPSRAPILFPVIGESPAGKVRHAGRSFPMNRHGFARDMVFEPRERSDSAVTLALRDSEETRRHYPFSFELTLTFSVAGQALDIAVTATNTGTGVMPASFGFHPAFRWPLVPGAAREAHVCLFDQDESEPIIPINTKTGLMLRHDRPSPVRGRRIPLNDALFDEGALVFARHKSRTLFFGVPGERGILTEFPLMPQLGVWTRPGFPFLCIEPWHGIADYEGADGELANRPGITMLEPGANLRCGMRIAIAPVPKGS